jgi:hypothetical protein
MRILISPPRDMRECLLLVMLSSPRRYAFLLSFAQPSAATSYAIRPAKIADSSRAAAMHHTKQVARECVQSISLSRRPNIQAEQASAGARCPSGQEPGLRDDLVSNTDGPAFTMRVIADTSRAVSVFRSVANTRTAPGKHFARYRIRSKSARLNSPKVLHSPNRAPSCRSP